MGHLDLARENAERGQQIAVLEGQLTDMEQEVARLRTQIASTYPPPPLNTLSLSCSSLIESKPIALS